MKTQTTFIAAALVLALAVPGTADAFNPLQRTQAKQQGATELPPVEVQGEREAPQVDKGEAAKAGVQGCAIGSVLGGLFGVDSNVGCAVGGVAGFGMNYRRQLKDARDVEAAARAAGMQAEVRTEEVVDNRGKRQEAMSSLNITYDPADMEALDAGTRNTLDKLAALASKSKTPLTFRFEGSTAVCHVPQGELSKRGALEGHTVDNQCGKAGAEHVVVITPVPDVR